MPGATQELTHPSVEGLSKPNRFSGLPPRRPHQRDEPVQDCQVSQKVFILTELSHGCFNSETPPVRGVYTSNFTAPAADEARVYENRKSKPASVREKGLREDPSAPPCPLSFS